ncbi:MAG TPA: PAS domain S-box protein [Armatimonadota bacterium]|jgi:PAS domain S-box-containing protein
MNRLHGASGFSDQDLPGLATSALARLPQTFFIISIPDYRFVYLNDASLSIVKLVGIDDISLVLGKHPWDIFKNWKDSFLRTYEEACARKEVTFLGSGKYIGIHGDSYWDLVLIPNIDSATNEVSSISAIGTNVTDRVQFDNLNKSLDRINTAVASTLNLKHIMRNVVQEGTQAIGAESGLVSIREGDELIARYTYGGSRDILDARFTEEQYPLAAIAIRTKKPVVINDVYSDKRIDKRLAEKYQLRSILLLPLIAKSQVVGLLSFQYHSKTAVFSQAVVDFGTKLASSASLALENARLFKELRDELEQRKRAEKDLHRYRLFFQHSRDMMVMLLPDGQIIEANDAASNAYHYRREELLTMNVRDLRPAEAKASVEGHLKEASSKGIRYETVGLRKDGSTFPVEASARGVNLAGRRVIINVIRDITDRRRVEHALKHSEERFRAIFDRAGIGIALADVDRHIVVSNAAYQKFLGYSQEELADSSFSMYTHKDDIDADAALFRELLSGKRDVYQIEKRYVRKDGQILWGRLTVSLVKSDCGEPQFAIGMAEDITERVRALQALDAERQRFRTILDVLPVGVFIADASGRIELINRAVSIAWGGDPPPTGKIAEYSNYKGRSVDDGKPLKAEDWALARALMKGETSIGDLVDIERFDGLEGTIFNSAVPLLDSEGRITGAVAVVQDITGLRQLERKASELASKEAEARSTLQAILDTAPTGTLVAQADGKITYFNMGIVRIFGQPVTGTTAGPAPGSYQLLLPAGYPCPAEELPLARSLAHGESLRNVELVVRRTDGTEVSVLVNSAPIRDQNGLVIAAVATLTDITEIFQLRRQVEKALERERYYSHMLQRALLPTIPSRIGGYRTANIYLPAFASREIGGDFYDMFETKDGRIGILIGDVSGKGLEAASFAASTRNTIHAFAHEMTSPAEVLTHANSVLYTIHEAFGLFVTVFLVLIDIESGEIRYSGAGHPPAAIHHTDSRVEFLDFGDPPIGLFSAFGFSEKRCRIDPGEKIILYTDGITEARHDSEMFGTEGIENILRTYGHRSPDNLVIKLVEAATSWANGQLRDDTAVLVVERCIDTD